MIEKPPSCHGCPMENIGVGFVPFELRPGPLMFVGEAPGEDEAKKGKCFVGKSGNWLRRLCGLAGINLDDITLTNTILCHPPDNAYPGTPDATYISKQDAAIAIAHCAKVHLWPNVNRAAKGKIYAIGGKALEALTGKVGINIWRGSPLPLISGDHPQVIGTIHPAALIRNPKQVSLVKHDLSKPLALAPEYYNLDPTLADVCNFTSEEFAFDLEWDSLGRPTICGLCSEWYRAMVVPFKAPYLDELKRIFESARVLIGHNIVNADLPHIEAAGFKLRDDVVIEDTMLKQHLCQPDYKHDLAFVASVFTQKVFWKGKGWEEEEEDGEINPSGQQWRTWDKPGALPIKLGGYGGCRSAVEAFNLYNARDTDGELQINTPLTNMLDRYDLQHVYRYVSLPVAYICRAIGERGLKIDTSSLTSIRAEVDETITALEGKLPDGLRPFEQEKACTAVAPPGTWRPVRKTCKGSHKNSHEPYILTFDKPDEKSCRVCGRVVNSGKMVEAKRVKGTKMERVVPYNSPKKVQAYVDGLALQPVLNSKTGRKTTGKRAKKIWGKEYPEFVVLGSLKEQVTLRNNFAKEKLLTQKRMMFNLKVTGTAEGRLSSTGQRRGIDLNIQNQPEDFRKIYVPNYPDWSFINLDIVQGENWLTAWIAKDWDRWERLQDPTYDEHAELATRIFSKHVSKQYAKVNYWHEVQPGWTDQQCLAEAKYYDGLRQIGKKINHGRNYGMGVRKQMEELASQGYDQYTQADVKEFIEIWKTLNQRTFQWQQETITVASQQGYLRNAFGRVRWFTSHSIATECLAFLPASTLADMVLRMMIAHYPNDPRIYPAIEANQLSVFAPMVDQWIMSIQVHDSLVHQGPDSSWREQAGRSKMIMEQPWPQLDNFRFKVEVKYSPESWGKVKTVEI